MSQNSINELLPVAGNSPKPVRKMLISLGPHGNQILAAAMASFGAVCMGSGGAYSSSAIPDLKHKINTSEIHMDYIDTETESWIGSILVLGGSIASFCAGFLVDSIGRRMTILNLCPPMIFGWLLIAFAVNHWMILVGRFVTGFCGGCFCLAAPLYVAEMAEDHIRGALGSIFQTLMTAGVLYGYAAGAAFDYKWAAIVSVAVPVIYFCGMFFIPESPKYLLMSGNVAEASRSLCWFRRADSAEDVLEEMKIIEQSVADMKAKKSTFKDLLAKYNLFPSFLLVSLHLFQQWGGINAIIFYTATIFKDAGSTLDPNISTVIIGVVQFIATWSSSFVVDRLGRKILLLASSVLQGLTLVILGIYFQLQSEGKTSGLGFIPLAALVLYIIGFSIGYGPVPWLMIGELVPQKVKARVGSIATVLNWGSAFLVVKFFPGLAELFTVQGCYWFFAGFNGIAFIFVLALLPETKGKSVEEIESIFGVPHSDELNRRVSVVVERRLSMSVKVNNENNQK